MFYIILKHKNINANKTIIEILIGVKYWRILILKIFVNK